MSFAIAFAGVKVQRRAVLSPCGTWRYTLERMWNPACFDLVCCLQNPSFADGERDDNTVKVLMAYAHSLGFGGLLIVNPNALVSTDPKQVSRHPDPVGPDNARHVVAAIKRATHYGRMLCGWGDAYAGARTDWILREMRNHGVGPACVAVTKAGNPGHPLRKRLPAQPLDWAAP